MYHHYIIFKITYFIFLQIVIEGNFTALEITTIYAKDAGTYTVIARNIVGEGRTACTLTIEGQPGAAQAQQPMAPKFLSQLSQQVVQEGAKARLDCVVIAMPEPEGSCFCISHFFIEL